MSEICSICKREFEKISGLKKHLSFTHKIKREDYRKYIKEIDIQEKRKEQEEKLLGISPKNEAEVIYLFSKYHKKLGFSRILSISGGKFPDIHAMRRGKVVGIEMEYNLKSFLFHYFLNSIEYGYNFSHVQKWTYNEKHKGWCRFINDEIVKNSFLYDSEKQLTTTKNESALIYKSLKSDVDIVICWIEDYEINDDIEIINLREQLEMINGVDKKQLTLDGYML